MFLVLLIPQIRLFKATQRHSISSVNCCPNFEPSLCLCKQCCYTSPEYLNQWAFHGMTCRGSHWLPIWVWFQWIPVTKMLEGDVLPATGEWRAPPDFQAVFEVVGIPSSKQTCLLWRIAVETDGPRIIDDHQRVALNQLWILICPDMTRYDPLFFVAQWSRITFWWAMVRWHPIAQLLIASERSYTTGWLGIITYITSCNH